MSDSLSERPKRDAAKKASAWNRSILIILFIPMPLAYVFFQGEGNRPEDRRDDRRKALTDSTSKWP